MLEEPDIPDEHIVSSLQAEYDVHVTELTFLPLGADAGTVVYRVLTEEGTAYFLKLRRGFEEITVTVPLVLKSQGIAEIISPIPMKSKQYWADFGEYTLILYPFLEGKDGFETELTDVQRRTLGTALRKIHSANIPLELNRYIPKETFDPRWREMLKSFQAQVETNTYEDVAAAKLADFMKSKRNEIFQLIERTGELASELQAKPLKMVLCHTDIHGGNILVGNNDQLYIVDWDNPLFAPKERDLMFVGGGIDNIWQTEREVAVFYEGYGKTHMNLSALTYYRYERIIEDLAVIAEQLLLTDAGGADRERSYGWFTSNFEPGGTIDIAEKTDSLLA